MKKWIALILTLVMVFSLGNLAVADEAVAETETSYVQETIEEPEISTEEETIEETQEEESLEEVSSEEETEVEETSEELTEDTSETEEEIPEETMEAEEETSEIAAEEITETMEETTEAATEETTEDETETEELLEAIRFSDVTDPSSPFYEPIYWAANKGIVTGYSDGRFGPGDTCTRKQFAIMLYRLAGKPAVSGSMPFPDCQYSSTSDSYKAILWAYRKGIVDGYSDGRFKPNNNVTRKQAMIMLYRYAGAPMVAGTLKFTDCAGSGRNSATYKAILWGVNNGITNGTSTTQFSPDNNCLRRQIVYFMYKMVNSGTAFRDDPKAAEWVDAKAAYLSLLDTFWDMTVTAERDYKNSSVNFLDLDGNGIKEMILAAGEPEWIICRIYTYKNGAVVNFCEEIPGLYMGIGANKARHSFFTITGDSNAIYSKFSMNSDGILTDYIQRYALKNGVFTCDKTVVYKTKDSLGTRYQVNGKTTTEKAANDKMEEITGKIKNIFMGDFSICMKASGYSFSSKNYEKYYTAMERINGRDYLKNDVSYPAVR